MGSHSKPRTAIHWSRKRIVDRVDATELALFEAGLRDAATFRHADHVRMAFTMLGRYGFERSLPRFGRAVRAMAAQVGRADQYHATVTAAFLSVIAERLDDRPSASWEEFATANEDLFERGCLERWYTPSRLASPLARRTFVLPEPPR